MAKLATNFFLPLAFFFFFFFFSSSVATAKTTRFSRNLSPESLGLRKQKLSHLHFYLHDIISGPKATTVRVAEASTTNASRTGFGAMVVMDDPLTVGPERSSEVVGKCQGIWASASQDDWGLLMVTNLAFTEGKYNGSTLSLLGRNMVMNTVREMPIVGGSGAFRFARGYAQAKTHTLDFDAAVVEYNVYVFHY